MPLLRDIKGFLPPFWITLRNMFRKPVTVEYPEQKPELPERYRARLILTRDPDGEERCVACQLCSAACPVDCISLQATEDAHGRRYPAFFRINFSKRVCRSQCGHDYFFCCKTANQGNVGSPVKTSEFGNTF